MNLGRVLFPNTFRGCSKLLYRNFNKRTQKFDYEKVVKVNKQANRKPRLNLILKEDVPNLGVAGQMVQVKRGYGRNYLILNRLAVYATEENKQKYLATQTDQGSANVVADQKILPFFESAVLEMGMKDGAEHWQITEHDISVHCRKKLNVVVPVHCIEMAEPVKSFGDHVVGIIINENVCTKLKLLVVPL